MSDESRWNSPARTRAQGQPAASRRRAAWLRAIAGMAGPFGLAACGGGSPEPQLAAAPVTLEMPADPTLSRLYAQTCMACHTTPASGAPLSGDAQAWAPRVAQGMDVMLERTINGFQGMPPLGSCMDCGEDEFRALIRYMARLP